MASPDLRRLPPAIGANDLCRLTTERAPFSRDGWIFELKHDGFRALARRGAHGIQVLSRVAFPEIVAALSALTLDVILDGELVVLTADGRSDFDELRRRSLMQRAPAIAAAAHATPAVLIVFDVLHANGRDLRPLPLAERRAWLLER